ncbi:MAG: leucine--tRNA ligase [Bacteroidia bacterium]|nr:leucine--tRNA ligase [Bacteroidia bacterium]MCF8425991.1 leucine--tRNA ligase [Bacteroidia bacterium]
MSKDYNHQEIETRWQKYWSDNKIYEVTENPNLPKYYVLDMFPYPSGAGLHVGHPLGYIASDIYSRYKRLKGFNVLHPMGYDAFGLPAEQYAIQTGQHPSITTEQNIKRYREQMDKIGFSYDWSREVRTSDPDYYKWTQWIFLQLFNSWFNPISQKAEPISTLVTLFETEGFKGSDDSILTGGIEFDYPAFTAEQWKKFGEVNQQKIILGFRLAYLSEAYVNWCPAMGTVLSNDEVKDGVSERGGYPVERKLMNQWSLRITAYANRLLTDLDELDWTESLKESQRNWIGKSQGASVLFKVQDQKFDIEVFTTRPDTIFGVSFLAIAPEHEMLDQLVTPERQFEVMDYVEASKNRSERERQSDVKRVSGEFTGAYAVHPFTGKEVPIWVADYVLGGYGTGAVMGVPAHDSRDFAFAKFFNLAILPVIENGHEHNFNESSFDAKEGNCINSGFLNGMGVKKAMKKAIEEIELRKCGKGKTNFRLRDAIFGRQRYWGEPIPIYYKDGIPYGVEESDLPVILPKIDTFLPTESGEPPLGRAENWLYKNEYPYELSTMPGWAGSSWYFLRYMNPNNTKEMVSKDAVNYWQQVDLYLGGSEHATGHLLYVRFWTKFLFDLGLIPCNEPAKKLINQGMIQGRSNFVFRVDCFRKDIKELSFYASKGFIDENEKIKNIPQLFENFNQQNNLKVGFDFTKINVVKLNVDVNLVENDVLNTEAYKQWREDFADALFVLEDGKYYCTWEVEKMSKSKWNVVTPDFIIEQYGADTLRLYEMFLGPLEQSKPWNTQGIEGVQRFLKKLWRLFFDANGQLQVIRSEPSKQEYKALHKTIKKVAEDIENFSFNTSVSTFMICVNELTELKCKNHEILKNLLVTLSPYAPHISEELWNILGETESITKASFPAFVLEYLIEDSFSYPISINGKHRTNIEFSLDESVQTIEETVLKNELIVKWLEGKTPKKVVFVKGKIVNLVV